jgi:hypothetical protein
MDEPPCGLGQNRLYRISSKREDSARPRPDQSDVRFESQADISLATVDVFVPAPGGVSRKDMTSY